MLRSEARILWTMLRGQPRTGALSDRLDSFYRPQADSYDAFRERLLHGRAELLRLLDLSPGQSVVELGGGTARNLDFYRDRLEALDSVTVVDLCPALLEQARSRCRHWDNVTVVEADATEFQPRHPVDRVYFSYSLTMMPEWRRAIDNAMGMLRTGGLIGVVDFFVSHPEPSPGRTRHGPVTRGFWPRWFRHDGVYLNPEHVDHLLQICTPLVHQEHRGVVPWLPWVRAPYYIFVGRKGGV